MPLMDYEVRFGAPIRVRVRLRCRPRFSAPPNSVEIALRGMILKIEPIFEVEIVKRLRNFLVRVQ